MSPASARDAGKTFSCILINDIEKSKFLSVAKVIFHKVITPYMIGILRSQPDAAAVIEPQSASFLLFLRNFQSFFPPDPLHSFMIDTPALCPEQGSNTAIPVSSIVAGQSYHPTPQCIFILSADRCISSDSLTDLYRPACAALADAILLLYLCCGRPPFGRAYKFPSAISFNIALSRLRSATSFLSLAFSFSSSRYFLCVTDGHTAILLAPSVVGLLRYADLPYGFHDGPSLAT